MEGLACIESVMDEIAYTLNLNPLDVRLANLDAEKYPKLKQFINEMKTENKLDQRMEDVQAYNKVGINSKEKFPNLASL